MRERNMEGEGHGIRGREHGRGEGVSKQEKRKDELFIAILNRWSWTSLKMPLR